MTESMWEEFIEKKAFFSAPFQLFIKLENSEWEAQEMLEAIFDKLTFEKELPPLFYETYTKDEGVAVRQQSGSKWLHVIDNWGYMLYHYLETAQIERFELTVFYFSVGDCDDSYDFTYYEKGKLIRRLEVKYPDFKDAAWKEFGEPLFFEKEPHISEVMPEPSFEYFLYLASSFGVPFNAQTEDITVFKLIDYPWDEM